MDERNESAKHHRVEDLRVYQKLCRLHLEVCSMTKGWPVEERFELASQVRRSSNSSPAQLAEKNDDRHVRNKVEGVNRARGEAAETIHHLYIAGLKGYLAQQEFESIRASYQECIRMLNGLERRLEEKLPPGDRRWTVREEPNSYHLESRTGYPADSIPCDHPSPIFPTPETRHLTPASP
jgi:four helix bundle protein